MLASQTKTPIRVSVGCLCAGRTGEYLAMPRQCFRVARNPDYTTASMRERLKSGGVLASGSSGKRRLMKVPMAFTRSFMSSSVYPLTRVPAGGLGFDFSLVESRTMEFASAPRTAEAESRRVNMSLCIDGTNG